MKSKSKKIVCIIAAVFMCCCSLATLVMSMVIKNFDRAIGKDHPFNALFYTMFGVSNTIMMKDFVYNSENSVYKLKNGYLAYKKKYVDVSVYEDELKEFDQYLSDLGVEFSYVITAEAGDERLNQLPFGVETNYCEQVTNELISVLKKNNIEYVETFKTLNGGSGDYYDYFYKTDHHWNDYAGVLLAQEISEHLNNEYALGINSSLFNESNYKVKTYKNTFLGSGGKKTGIGYVFPEDFDLLIPKYGTSFKVDYGDEIAEGEYFKSILYEDYLKNNPYYVSCYATYLRGDKPIISVKNLNCNNGKRLLVLKDSKANVINAHLASGVEYLDIIDLRYYKKSLKKYIEKTIPDVVLMIYSPFNTGAFYDFD